MQQQITGVNNLTVYYDEAPAYQEPKSQLEFSYRNFVVRKKPGYGLYSIVAPFGKVLHKSIEGDFSHIRSLEKQLDAFLAAHLFEEAFVDPEPPKPRRGRPPRHDLSHEASNQT
jgi:hypothetical protein